MATTKYYHLANTTTNELIFAKWTRVPCREQLYSIREYFGWTTNDELELRGKNRRFRLIGDNTLFFDSTIGYSRIVPDRTYLVSFDTDNYVERAVIVDTYDMIETHLE